MLDDVRLCIKKPYLSLCNFHYTSDLLDNSVNVAAFSRSKIFFLSPSNLNGHNVFTIRAVTMFTSFVL